MMKPQEVKKITFPSYRRKPGSSILNMFWTPAFAGVTRFRTFYETVINIAYLLSSLSTCFHVLLISFK
jgi:hypothetical protein